MGRGKKKGGKQTEEVPSVSSLTISESTSRASAEAVEASKPEAKQPMPETKEEKEVEGLGLGLGGKRRPKKKITQESTSQASAKGVEEQKPEAKEATPETKDQEEEVEGLALGLGGKRRPKKKKATPAAPTQTKDAPPTQQLPGTTVHAQPAQPIDQYASTSVQGAPPSRESTPGSVQLSQPGPSTSAQAATPWERGRAPAYQQTGPELTGQGVGTQASRGDGRGAGRGAGRRAGRGADRGRGRGEGYGAGRGSRTGGEPVQSYPTFERQQQPVQMPQTLQVSQPVYSRSSETVLSRYTIPAKVQSRNLVNAKPIRVLTNYLPMKIKDLKISRYDVSFKPDKPKKMLSKVFIAAQKKLFPQNLIAFDQMKNCYALHPLPDVPANDRLATNIEILDNNGRTMTFEVSFKATGVVDLGTILKYMSTSGTTLSPPTEAIQCIDVILRQGTLESYVKAGRRFFKRPARPIDLGDGLEMWTGLFQSAIFTSTAFINIDVAHKGFPKQQPLIDAIVNDFGLKTNQPIERQWGRGVENFQMFIKNLRVIALIGGDSTQKGLKREFICNGLVDPPSTLRFLMTDEKGKQKNITVAEYFAREKNVRLRYPNLNCMWVGPRDKNIYYPMELLSVAYGQALNKQLNEMQLSKMVREAATPPDDRKRKIEEVIQNMNYSRNTYFKQFGLEISDQFLEVNAKILAPPILDVGAGQKANPRNGAWQANGLLKPEALQTWGFIAIETDPNRCGAENMISLLMNMGRQMGMQVAPPMMNCCNVRMNELQRLLLTAVDKNINFLFIVVSGKGRDYYHKVKRMAELDVGILTQCVKENTAARRMNPQTARNILLKVNAKLMGINQALDVRCFPECIKGGGVMIVGADVTHPSPDQSSVPSIAAVTASIDPKCFMYNIELSIQTPKKEMIVEFQEMMIEHFKVYRRHQNSMPKKIFVFRDGVSEGQFAQVLNSEVKAVYDAYERMTGTDVKPEVLFLLVQKRHHTRLFTKDRTPQNVEPGTVVDQTIVHAKELDFYMVSHQAIKGTARPTRYHVIRNDGNIPYDEIEQLTYYLCHLYSRCMRAVSYPTPTYYAHLACLRARSLTYGDRFDNLQLERKPQRLHVLDKMLEFSRMFFV